MTSATIARRETVEALRTIRELWGELLLAIETPPADVWPPRQLAHTMRDDDALLVETRAPLVLREHPAPLNLRALDTGRGIEGRLFDLADVLAAQAQQQTPLSDPRRWMYRSDTSPGSRAYGLHWAAVWIEGRVLDEDTTPEPALDGALVEAPFAPVSEALLREAHSVARWCEGRLLAELGLDQRETPVPDRPCPWCAGLLVLHTGPEQGPAVTCATGPACSAPVALDSRGRRVWQWGDLLDLVAALGTGGSVAVAQVAA
ncbi:hypothetical protein LE181_15055 [Streptomyces sp. SCA3-4]|uniref:hypothetical protein n=1 Tax=Streptomyces sichuanensis TaxID=2871810 RepID=UPI001CE27862|nr:hypothetical protein [Streptomyces sichuanensis]MCA6093473.1 hypothetical protein [Streptomyces sichuanensis]